MLTRYNEALRAVVHKLKEIIEVATPDGISPTDILVAVLTVVFIPSTFVAVSFLSTSPGICLPH
jgi:hypothetical protein